jgi:dihydroorotase
MLTPLNNEEGIITLLRPDDCHLHLRDGPEMCDVLIHSACQFARAVIMPNLQPPITTTKHALEYRKRILRAIPDGLKFQPLMTLFLTEDTSPSEIRHAKLTDDVIGIKLYPAGITTNADYGIKNFYRIYPLLEVMQEQDLVLLLHGEIADQDVDIFDREAIFIDRVLKNIVERFPALRVVLEHITTRDAVDYVQSASNYVAATITAHHLLYNRNNMFADVGLRPHYYCRPILKRECHRKALVQAAISGNPKYFLGTDSAPHASIFKESAVAVAGCYTANSALALYAEVFDAAGALDKLEGFASFYGADFYKIPRNNEKLTLYRRKKTLCPSSFPFGNNKQLVPLRAGEIITWQPI